MSKSDYHTVRSLRFPLRVRVLFFVRYVTDDLGMGQLNGGGGGSSSKCNPFARLPFSSRYVRTRARAFLKHTLIQSDAMRSWLP